jgi:hypothetical protein
MADGLGYGSGVVLRQTFRNNSASADIAIGQGVMLINTGLGASGVGDQVLLGSPSVAAVDPDILGVSEKVTLQGASTGEGEWGMAVVYGLTQVLAGEAGITANMGLVLEAATGRFVNTGTAAAAILGQCCGVALSAGGDGDLVWAFVNFLNRDIVAGSAYGGALA